MTAGPDVLHKLSAVTDRTYSKEPGVLPRGWHKYRAVGAKPIASDTDALQL
jgi:hypothetical protein